MENRVKSAIRNIELSGIRRFNELAKSKENMIFFTIGEPYFNTPENVKRVGIEAIENNHTFYTQNQGSLAFREAVSRYVQENYHLNYSSSEVIATVGSMEGLSTTLSTLIEPEDEVIIPTPCYPGYAPLITMNGGKVVEMNTKQDDFQLSEQAILSHITPKTKAILITSPNNPSGCVYSKASIEALLSCVKDREIFVISDEVYREIVYDAEKFVSIGEYESVREKVIIISGFSKSHSMTGWRVGYVLADSSIAKHILKTHQYLVTSTCTISQYAAIEALKTSNRDMIDHYLKNRNYGVKRVHEMGLDMVEASGAFYFFICIEKFGISSVEFCTRLLENGVACIPGEYFGEGFDDYIRLSYACNFQDLQEGLDRLEKFIEGF